jgi:hypothetical protein
MSGSGIGGAPLTALGSPRTGPLSKTSAASRAVKGGSGAPRRVSAGPGTSYSLRTASAAPFGAGGIPLAGGIRPPPRTACAPANVPNPSSSPFLVAISDRTAQSRFCQASAHSGSPVNASFNIRAEKPPLATFPRAVPTSGIFLSFPAAAMMAAFSGAVSPPANSRKAFCGPLVSPTSTSGRTMGRRCQGGCFSGAIKGP